MAKFKPCNEDQLVMLPISLQDQLVPGTLEHTLSRLMDKHIDLSVFDARHNNDETGAADKWDSPRFTNIFLASGSYSSQAEFRPTHLWQT